MSSTDTTSNSSSNVALSKGVERVLTHQPSTIVPLLVDSRGVPVPKELQHFEPAEEISPYRVSNCKSLSRVVAVVAHGRPKTLGIAGVPGVGKSTQVPVLLARLVDEVVIVVTETESLAASVEAGLRRFPNNPVPIVADAGQDLRKMAGSTIFVTTVYKFLARLIISGLPEAYFLIHDEAHVNSYASHVIRTHATTFVGMVTYVAMSATLSAQGTEAAAIPKTDVVIEKIDIPSPTEWSATSTAPWSVAQLVLGNTLVLSDEPGLEVYGEYAAAGGVQVLALNRDSSAEDVRAVTAVAAAKAAGVLIIADTSFRNGFTFNIDTVIDTGRVRETVGIDIDPSGEVWRPAYAFEEAQAVGRVGRFKAGRAYISSVPTVLKEPILPVAQVEFAHAACALMGKESDPLVMKLSRLALEHAVPLLCQALPYSTWLARLKVKHGPAQEVDAIGPVEALLQGLAIVARAEFNPGALSDTQVLWISDAVKDLVPPVWAQLGKSPVDEIVHLVLSGARWEVLSWADTVVSWAWAEIAKAWNAGVSAVMFGLGLAKAVKKKDYGGFTADAAVYLEDVVREASAAMRQLNVLRQVMGKLQVRGPAPVSVHEAEPVDVQVPKRFLEGTYSMAIAPMPGRHLVGPPKEKIAWGDPRLSRTFNVGASTWVAPRHIGGPSSWTSPVG